MGNSKSKNNKTSDKDTKQPLAAKVDYQESCLNLHGYPPINFRKIKKSGFRIGAHVDIGMTFGKNNINEIQFSKIIII